MTPARLDEIVTLYTVSGLTIRKIADRYGETALTIKALLLGAGVELRDRPSARPTGAGSNAAYGSYKPTDIVQADRIEAAERENGNRAHIAALAQALRGEEFPVLNLGRR